MNTRDLLDDAVLRRALRLDASERPPYVDIAAIARLAAERDRSRPVAAFAVSAVAGFAGAALLVLGSLAGSAIAPSVTTDVLGASIAVLAQGVFPLVNIATFAQQPTLAMALLTALAFGIVYSLIERREPRHIRAS